MKIYDTFLFYNELDLLELRLNTLGDLVDYFVITEARVTFSGRSKPLYFAENRNRFSKFEDKIIHNVIESTPNDFTDFVAPNPYYTDRRRSYPQKSNGTPLQQLSIDFQREVFQRDSIINGLIGRAQPSDLIIISDLDEIPNPEAIRIVVNEFSQGKIYNLCQRWYMYYLNVYCENEWFGTRICDFNYLNGKSIDLMRYHLEDRTKQPGPIVENGGWHFSFLGGHEKVKEKLSAYSYQGRRSKFILKILDQLFPSRIKNAIKSNKDIFNTGRVFRAVALDSSFPVYLRNHLDKYKNLIKNDCN